MRDQRIESAGHFVRYYTYSGDPDDDDDDDDDTPDDDMLYMMQSPA